MDDIRPPRNTDGFGTPPKDPSMESVTPNYSSGTQNSSDSTTSPQDVHQAHHESSMQAPIKIKNSSKGLKAWLIIFIVLFLGAAGYAGWQYVQIKDYKSDIDDITVKNQQLQTTIDSLQYDNNDLRTKLNLQ